MLWPGVGTTGVTTGGVTVTPPAVTVDAMTVFALAWAMIAFRWATYARSRVSAESPSSANDFSARSSDFLAS